METNKYGTRACVIDKTWRPLNEHRDLNFSSENCIGTQLSSNISYQLHAVCVLRLAFLILDPIRINVVKILKIQISLRICCVKGGVCPVCCRRNIPRADLLQVRCLLIEMRRRSRTTCHVGPGVFVVPDQLTVISDGCEIL